MDTRWRLFGGVIVAVVGLGLLAGCTTTRPPAAVPVAKVVDSYFCPSGETSSATPLPEAGRVPKGFAAVAAYRCTTSTVPAGVETEEQAVTADRLEGDLGPLLAALAKQNDPIPQQLACAAMAEVVPELWLVDASGRAVHVAWPRTACNFTKPGVREALEKLTVAATEPAATS